MPNYDDNTTIDHTLVPANSSANYCHSTEVSVTSYSYATVLHLAGYFEKSYVHVNESPEQTPLEMAMVSQIHCSKHQTEELVWTQR